MLRVVPEWVRLLVWPAHLSSEYGPQQIQVIDGPTAGGVFGIVFIVGVVAAFVVCLARHRTVAFGLAWLAITFVPVSNLVSGVVLQERTLMLPSVGAVLILGAGFQWLWDRTPALQQRYALAVLAGLLVIAGALRSAARNPVWRDNLTLFTQMVEDAPLAYRAHYLYGSELFTAGRAPEGERELRLAISLARNDSDPYNFLATKYREVRLYAQAIPLYRQALTIRPGRPDSRFGLALSLLETGDASGARAQADSGLASGQLKSYFEWVRTRADSALLTRVLK
jgi:protein O-mannosyl-transferase